MGTRLFLERQVIRCTVASAAMAGQIGITGKVISSLGNEPYLWAVWAISQVGIAGVLLSIQPYLLVPVASAAMLLSYRTPELPVESEVDLIEKYLDHQSEDSHE